MVRKQVRVRINARPAATRQIRLSTGLGHDWRERSVPALARSKDTGAGIRHDQQSLRALPASFHRRAELGPATKMRKEPIIHGRRFAAVRVVIAVEQVGEDRGGEARIVEFDREVVTALVGALRPSCPDLGVMQCTA